MNFTRQLDTRLANDLQNLPEFATAEQDHLKFLAARNLLRGRLVGLPTGQAVANKLGVTPLTPAEVAGLEGRRRTRRNSTWKRTLWFYILKEAEVKHGGLHLGDVGSRLVAETFHGLVEGSDFSIVRESSWKPSLPSHEPNRFTMNDLLTFVDDLNPLGDPAITAVARPAAAESAAVAAVCHASVTLLTPTLPQNVRGESV